MKLHKKLYRRRWWNEATRNKLLSLLLFPCPFQPDILQYAPSYAFLFRHICCLGFDFFSIDFSHYRITSIDKQNRFDCYYGSLCSILLKLFCFCFSSTPWPREYHISWWKSDFILQPFKWSSNTARMFMKLKFILIAAKTARFYEEKTWFDFS